MGNSTGLCSVSTFEEAVKSFYQRGPSVSLDALEKHGLGAIISPPELTTWEAAQIRLNLRAGETFGFSPEETTDPRDDCEGSTWRLLRVEEDLPA